MASNNVPGSGATIFNTIVTIISIVITTISVFFPNLSTNLGAIKPYLFFFSLFWAFITSITAYRYISKAKNYIKTIEEKEQNSQNENQKRIFDLNKKYLVNIERLLQTDQNITDQFKQKLVEHFQCLCRQDFKFDFGASEDGTLQSICHTMTTHIKRLFLLYYEILGYNISPDDLSVCIKLLLTQAAIVDLLKNRISADERDQISKKEKWVITAYRDPDTHEFRKDREVRTKIYDIDNNTAFIYTIKDHNKYFSQDDLQRLGEAYLNKNNKWKSHYNATGVAPIKFKLPNDGYENYNYFGVVAIDSLNSEKLPLFTNKFSEYILCQAADLLAIYFFYLCYNTDRNCSLSGLKSAPDTRAAET